MTLTPKQKAAVAGILKGAAARARHELVHSDRDEEREFYRGLVAQAEILLPIFDSREPVEVEDEEEEEEEE